MPSSPPPVIHERYRLSEWLGQGSMGVVYLAHDDVLDRPVVIKFRSGGVPDSASRFLREARAVARLAHPHIMAIYDVGSQAGWDYLVLEFVPGRDLLDYVRQQGGRLPVSEALRLGRSILEALDYAHQHGILHRDIKPENIKLTPDGQVKLMDFSLALPEGETRLTQENAVVGTVLYLAPECLSGQGSDARADLYALGAVLYELLTGRPVFEGDGLSALIGSILYGTPLAPRSLAPEIPPVLESWLLRMLARDPGGRYLSARAALEDLQAIDVLAAAPVDSPDPLAQASANGGANFSAIEEERRRLAGLLQDRVVEPLGLLLAQASTFEQTLSAQPPARMALSVIATLARQVLQQARDLEAAMHPVVLDALGLEPALELLKEQAGRASGLNLALNLERLPRRLPPALEVTLFRVAQEALDGLPGLFVRQAALRMALCKAAPEPALPGDVLLLELTWPGTATLPGRAVEALRARLAPAHGLLESAPGCLSARVPLRSELHFTQRELDVLQGLVEGLTNKELAARLAISPRTINYHLENIYAKLGISTRTEAALLALRQGWARRPSDVK